MQIQVIDTAEGLAKLESEWVAIYNADPEAEFFLSWKWMSRHLLMLGDTWFVLAARPREGEPCVGLFPLRISSREIKPAVFVQEISMAGNYEADYTGFICMPEHEEVTIAAFSAAIAKMNWARLNLEYLPSSNGRLQTFLARFRNERFVIAESTRINKTDNIDNCICPHIDLPGSWDDYLRDCLSANARYKLRRAWREMENSETLRITLANADTLDRDLKILLEMWKTKWGARKGTRLRNILVANYRMLTRSFESGLLFMPVLWNGDQPIGALANLVDADKKSMLFYIGGRDESFTAPPPGFILHAFALRHAIAEGFRRYDFLRGNEPYKYLLGAKERMVRCIAVGTADGRNLRGRIDPRGIPAVLRYSRDYHRAGRAADAMRGYQQVLAVAPRNFPALYCLGQLEAAQGNHAAAIRSFKAAIPLAPEPAKVWLRLGVSLRAHGRSLDAIEAFRKAITADGSLAEAHRALGVSYYGLGRHHDAVASFETALRHDPANDASRQSWARTLQIVSAGGQGDDAMRAAAAFAGEMDRLGSGELAAFCRGRIAALQAGDAPHAAMPLRMAPAPAVATAS